MSDYGWFKLLVRAVGILLLGLSLPMLLWTVGGIILMRFQPGYENMSLGDSVVGYLPTLSGYGAQVGIGLYLLLGAEKLIARCIREVQGQSPGGPASGPGEPAKP